ncbi:MAG: S41 family peptidase, partial [Gemmatimonadota bacterium]|nr:S41 family peptidase [Gemmatimonadota bacterium]
MTIASFARCARAVLVTGAAAALTCAAPLSAQQGGSPSAPPALDAGTRRAVVDSLGTLLVRVYVDADTGRMIAERLRERLRAGAYESLSDPADFALALTQDLRSVNQDGHLVVQFAPGAPVDRLGPDTLEFAGLGGGDDAEAVEAQARGFHYGLGKLELLTGNVGYAELTGFFDGENAERMMLAALEYLKDADAIILDLRRHGGGSGDMSNWFLSHFLEGDSLLTLRIAERVNRRTVDRFTRTDVPGPRLTDAPVFILTSRATASAAEDVTFVLDNLGRAVVVGDRTAGAGHNNTFLAVG